MNKKNFLLTALVILISSQIIFAEDKNSTDKNRNFTFEDAMQFELYRRAAPKISNNGNWFGYETQKDRGDVAVHINSTDSANNPAKFYFENAVNLAFSNNSNWAAMTIVANQMENENAKSPKDKPSNSLKLLNLNTKAEFEHPNLQNYKFSEDSKWFVYKIKNDENKPKMDKFKEKNLGSILKIRHLNSGTDITIDWVSEYLLDTNSKFIFYSISEPKGKKDGIYCRELTKEFAPERKIISAENANFSNLAWNEKQNLLAFLSANLNEKGKPNDCSLLIWSEIDRKIDTIIVDTIIPDSTFGKFKYPENWFIPHKNNIYWNDTKALLFFGFKPISEKIDEKEAVIFKDSTFYNVDTILEKTEVHIWHWNDPLIMTQQQFDWNREKDKIYTAVYNHNSKQFKQLADTLADEFVASKNNNFAFILSEIPYKQEKLWAGDFFDIYIVNLENGNKAKIAEKVEEFEPNFMSKNGNFAVFYKNKHWFLYDTKNNKTTNLTENVPTNFNDIFQDIPSNPFSCGFGGWLDNDKGLFIYDNFDIWYFDIANASTANNYRNFTKNGKQTNTKYTLRKVDRDEDFHKSNDTLLISAFNKKNKNAGIFNGFINLENKDLDKIEEKIAMSPQFFRDIRKAKDVNKIFFAKEQYDEYPNYWVTDFAFNSPKRVSDLNLAIKDTFNWGTTELVEWNFEDTTLQGYLVKPDNYDANKKYPLFVYFYDQMSDRMNRFYMPELTHRPVNQIYMDNYIMFFVDIAYGVGSPGNDALESILSGCRYLAEKGVIDSTKTCIQGHSWGAYQAAYIVTQTDYFKAACAGAPVGNMTSAYSGIRLGSGRARQFQYEAQQSRIGGNLWDSLDAYIRNSPIFFAEKMNTPFLIEFGDIDEAVPWEQGIELFLALKRAKKPAIMLQYVNEPHWPGRYWNKLDYSIKMKEFFDHYLLEKPAPKWILEGKPYKGEKY
jgi:dipeptidyl aminopeptidase/acylaminoacyl peptidase